MTEDTATGHTSDPIGIAFDAAITLHHVLLQLQQARTSPSQHEGGNGMAGAAVGEEEEQEASSSAGDGDDEVSLPALHPPLLCLLLVCPIQVITALPETAEPAL